MDIRTTASTCLALLALASPAAADQILFSNLGPHGAYAAYTSTFFGFTEEQTNPDYNFSRAMPFTVAASAALTTVEMPLKFPWFTHPWFQGGTLEVNLFESDGGLPGRVLESFQSGGTHTADTLTMWRSALNPQLTAGVMYFLEARAIGEANGLWYLTTAKGGGNVPDYRFSDGSWTVGLRNFEAAFRISGDTTAAPVPEPATLVLLGTGMAIAWRRRSARQAVARD